MNGSKELKQTFFSLKKKNLTHTHTHARARARTKKRKRGKEPKLIYHLDMQAERTAALAVSTMDILFLYTLRNKYLTHMAQKLKISVQNKVKKTKHNTPKDKKTEQTRGRDLT